MTTRAWMAAALLGISVAGCSANGPAEAQVTGAGPNASPSSVSGTVAYRERMALPPDATVEVWITDIGPGIVTMAVLAEATVPANGRQVPLPFEVAVDPARVSADRPYGVRAVIRAGGQTLFETREPVPVLTQGQPRTVALMLTRATSEAPPAGAAPTLVGTTWRLEDLAGAGVVAGADATLEFPEEGRVAGRGSCNRFFGPVTISGATIRFGMLGATQMACAEPIGEQEARFFAALRAAECYEIEGTTLRIFGADAAAPLRFVRITP